MSSAPVSNIPPRKSFAQVAASAHKPTTALNDHMPNATNLKTEELEPQRQGKHEHIQIVHSPSNPERALTTDAAVPSTTVMKRAPTDLSDAHNGPSTAPSDNGQLQIDGLPRRDYSDTKSVASRTTLTLDEKESLRPDDSASVQAAIEEDSPVGSRVGSASDPDARAFRDQLHEIERNGPARYLTQRNMPSAVPHSAQRSAPLSFNDSPEPGAQGPVLIDPEAQRQAGQPSLGYDLPPDEKLLEALASPKDRLFVLKIEQDMIDFVKDSKENFLQLPQTNSFYRMLSHKLADYYCLSHVVDESLTSVRIYRTPHCRLPPPLIGPDPATGGSTPPPSAPARKIMRRGDTDELGLSGTGTRNSKTTSELDGSGSENNPKDKTAMTREERENRYKETRARIFKDFKEGNTGANELPSPSNEADNSRSSSRSGLRPTKSKKSRKPRDDTFEARSAYSQVPSQQFIPHQYQQGGQDSMYAAFANMNVSGAYPAGPVSYQQATQPYSDGSMAPQHPLQTGQWYPQPYSQPFGMAQGMVTSGHYAPQNDTQMSGSFQGFQPYQSPNQATPKPASTPLAYMNQGFHQSPKQGQNWVPAQYHQQQLSTQPMYYGQQSGVSNMQGGGQMMFAYPGPQPDAHFQGQHNRHFNPASQSFVPGMAMPGMHMMQSQQFPFAPQQPQQQQQQQQFGNGNGLRYTTAMMPNDMMQRQLSSHSHTSGFAPIGPQQQHGTHQGSRSNTYQMQQQQQQQQQQQLSSSTISKWANAASLPSKPPAPASSLAFQVPPNSMGKQPLPPNPLVSSTSSSRPSSAALAGSSGGG